MGQENARQAEPAGKRLNWWRRFRRSDAHTQANIVCTIIVAVATVFYTVTAWRQLRVMRETLAEMQRSGSQSTQQMWSGIGNINWLARSADWSQKVAQQQATDTVTEMQKQTFAQSGAAQSAQLSANTARDAFSIGNRPWVKITPEIATPLTFDQLRNGGPMAIMTIKNHVENVGQSVALNVTVYEDVVPFSLDISGVLAKRKDRCDAHRHTYQSEAGTVRFPHDAFVEGQVVGPSMADIQRVIYAAQKDPVVSRMVNPGEISFALIGCVSYRSSFEPSDTPRHQTAFFYLLGVPSPDGSGMSTAVEPKGVANQLRLIETPMYFSAD